VDLLVDRKESMVDQVGFNEYFLIEFILLQLMFQLGGKVILDVLNAIIIEAIILSCHYDLVDSRNECLLLLKIRVFYLSTLLDVSFNEILEFNVLSQKLSMVPSVLMLGSGWEERLQLGSPIKT
jgi:hypothetical protein